MPDGGVEGIERASAASPAPSEADVALLWAAARTDPDVSAVRDAARGARIPDVLTAAGRQRVAPLVLRALDAAGVTYDSGHPSVVRTALWDAHARVALPAAAALTLEPLAAAGLRPLALKGLGLIDRYPAPGLRPMDDFDVLLPRELVRHASRVLRDAGWRRMRHRDPDPGYDIVFAHPSVPGVPLELHWNTEKWRERTNGVDAARLWASRIDRTVLGHPAYGLPPELELLSLVTHAAKRFHLFGRLLWGVDFTVVARTPGLDWDAVGRLAASTRSRLAVAVGLRIARRLGAIVPDELLVLPASLERRGALDVLLDPARPFGPKSAVQRWMAFALIDRPVDRLRLGVGDLLRPARHEPRGRIVRQFVRALWPR